MLNYISVAYFTLFLKKMIEKYQYDIFFICECNFNPKQIPTFRCLRDEKQFWSIVSSIFEARLSIRMFSAPLKVKDVRFLNRFPANLNPNNSLCWLNIPSGNWAIKFSPISSVLSVLTIDENVLSSCKLDIWFASNDKSWTDVQSLNVFLKKNIKMILSFEKTISWNLIILWL